MGLSVKSGTFEHPATTGNYSISGVGFQPKVLLLWHVNKASGFGADSHLQVGMGAATSSSARWAVLAASKDAVATSVAFRRSTASGCLLGVSTVTGAINLAADFVSFDGDGFTLNATTVQTGAPKKISYLVMGGSDITNAVAGNLSLGNSAGNVSATGLGFQPDLCLFAGVAASPAAASAAECIFSFGAAIDASNQWLAAVGAQNAQGTSKTYRYQRTDRILAQVFNDSVTWDADFVSMDADGFTVNANSGTNNDVGFYVALRSTVVSSRL